MSEGGKGDLGRVGVCSMTVLTFWTSECVSPPTDWPWHIIYTLLELISHLLLIFFILPPPHPAHPQGFTGTRQSVLPVAGSTVKKTRGWSHHIISPYFTPGEKKRDGLASNFYSSGFITSTFHLELYAGIIYFRCLMGILTYSVYHVNHQGYFIKTSRWQNLQ